MLSSKNDAAPSRRAVLSAVAGSAVLLALRPGGETSAAALQLADTVSSPASGQLVRGGVRQYARPRIAPGYRLLLPAGATVLAHGARAATQGHRWPRVHRDGRVVDLGAMAAVGAPTQKVVLSGFPGGRGWYEITDDRGRVVDRREWDAKRLPYLRLRQEWGATGGFPYWNALYAVNLEPVSLAA